MGWSVMGLPLMEMLAFTAHAGILINTGKAAFFAGDTRNVIFPSNG
jgi:hypothetical protein